MKRKSGFRKFISYTGFSIAALSGALIANTLSNTSSQINPKAVAPESENTQLLTLTLSKAIQLNTTSNRDTKKIDYGPLQELHSLLQTSYPLLHRTLQVETINEHSLLYTWKGQNENLRPALFAAHIDVVEAGHDNATDWVHSPFSGAIADGYIWGRGALDDKAAVVAQLHAIESLLEQGFQSQRTVYLAFGQDEETGGANGAAEISKILARRGVKPEFLLDEGMPITDGILKGVSQPVALIGIAEKGYVNLELNVKSDGGHSSSPPRETAVGILAKAIHQIEQHPMPANLSGPVGKMFDTLTPEMNFPQRVVLSNRWLFAPLLETQLAAKNSTNALIRTTAAPTMLEGSQQENVLPANARAIINYRILPGDDVEAVITHATQTINDERVSISIYGNATEPSDVSATNSKAYTQIATSVREVFPEVLVAPALLIAATDTRHYASLADNVYRFRPLFVGPDDIKRFHGSNERIGTENLLRMTAFYKRLFKNINNT